MLRVRLQIGAGAIALRLRAGAAENVGIRETCVGGGVARRLAACIVRHLFRPVVVAAVDDDRANHSKHSGRCAGAEALAEKRAWDESHVHLDGCRAPMLTPKRSARLPPSVRLSPAGPSR